jgi:hypothetical protein
MAADFLTLSNIEKSVGCLGSPLETPARLRPTRPAPPDKVIKIGRADVGKFDSLTTVAPLPYLNPEVYYFRELISMHRISV